MLRALFLYVQVRLSKKKQNIKYNIIALNKIIRNKTALQTTVQHKKRFFPPKMYSKDNANGFPSCNSPVYKCCHFVT